MTADSAGNIRYPLIDAANADTLVIHCADPRFRAAFQEFIHQQLEIENPILIVIPGGIHDLVATGREDAAQHLGDQLEFMLRITKAQRVVLIDHDDCQWYKRLTADDEAGDPDDAMKSAAEELGRSKPGITVSCFRARLEDGSIAFDRI
jgi:hypothetical protein